MTTWQREYSAGVLGWVCYVMVCGVFIGSPVGPKCSGKPDVLQLGTWGHAAQLPPAEVYFLSLPRRCRSTIFIVYKIVCSISWHFRQQVLFAVFLFFSQVQLGKALSSLMPPKIRNRQRETHRVN